jgi:O-glycosyl hydrolase
VQINKPFSRAGIPALLVACIALRAGATVTVNYSAIIDTIPDYFHGVNFVGFWDDYQASNGSRDALRRAGVQLISFPGGVPGDYYDWQLPTRNNMSKTSPVQLYTYASAIGAKVLFQTNAGCAGGSNCTAQHAADWVTYCKSNNIPVYLWEVGNEPEYWSGTGVPQGGQYFDIYRKQSTAMHTADATATVIGPASNFMSVCRSLVDSVGATNIDGFSIHWYGGGGWNTVRSSAQVSWPALGRYMKNLNTAKKPWFVTEWSVLGATTGDVANTFNQEIGAALAYMDVIGMLTRIGAAGHFMFGCIHGVEGNWGILGGKNDVVGIDEPCPSYFVFPIATKLGNIAIDLDNTENDSTSLSAYSTRKKGVVGVQVLMINKTNIPKSTTINFIGYNPSGATVEAYELKPTSGGVTATAVTYNGSASVFPATAELPAPSSSTCSGTTFTRSLPGYSITLLNFKGGALAGSTNRLPEAHVPLHIAVSNRNRMVTLSWNSDRPSSGASMAVYDVCGRLVEALHAPVGGSQFIWDANRCRPGSYVLRIDIGGTIITRDFPLQ